MKAIKTLSVFLTTIITSSITSTSIPAFAQHESTIINYEYPNAKAIYLNVCDTVYALPSGRCGKINLVNRRLPTTSGTAFIPPTHLRTGVNAWGVLVIEIGNYRCVSAGSITGGSAYVYSGYRSCS